MLVCYLDDSDDLASRVVAMGGYLATTEDWKVYETEARRIYKYYSIETLHAVDFRTHKGQFTGWDKRRKADFISELFAITERFMKVCGISVCVSKTMHKAFHSAGKRSSQMSAYGLAFSKCIDAACTGRGLPALIPRGEVSFVVESGRRNAELAILFDRAKSRGAYGNQLQSLTFMTKQSCLAVHLADFWVMYSRRLAGPILAHPPNSDLNGYVPFELAPAFRHVPHAVEVLGGSITTSIHNRNEIGIGKSRLTWFGPLRDFG